VIIILASWWDEAARALAERWKDYKACLVTPKDLSRVGWCHYSGRNHISNAVISDRKRATSDICGVLVRLPWVCDQDLWHIASADRAYIGAEMNAFLVSWLSALPCPVLNRPTPSCLSGPAWRQENWIYIAGQLGIPVAPVRRSTPNLLETVLAASQRSRSWAVTVVGGRWFGSVTPELAMQAQLLAEASEVDLLVVSFDRPEAGALFVSASLWPDIANGEIADAIIEYYQDLNRRV
jgi:hypothetical protein